MTALDEVAWLLNLRGGDVEHNPVFISYVVVTADSASVYVDPQKVPHNPCCNPGSCPLAKFLPPASVFWLRLFIISSCLTATLSLGSPWLGAPSSWHPIVLSLTCCALD